MPTYTFKADHGINMYTGTEERCGFGKRHRYYVPGVVIRHATKADALRYVAQNQGNEHYHTQQNHRCIVTLAELGRMGWSKSMIAESVALQSE